MYLEQWNWSSILDRESVNESVIILIVVIFRIAFNTLLACLIISSTRGFTIKGRLLSLHGPLRHGIGPVWIPELVQFQVNDGPSQLADHCVENPSNQFKWLKFKKIALSLIVLLKIVLAPKNITQSVDSQSADK
jgi:hypothetical protein